MDEVLDAVSRLLDGGRDRCHANDGGAGRVPLERHVVTRSWEALAGSFELPLASVAVVGREQEAGPGTAADVEGSVEAARDRAIAAARDVQSSGPLNRTIASVTRQSYPRIEVIAKEPCARGQFVIPVRAGTVLDRDAVAQEVARRVREVGAGASNGNGRA